jgi:hypothetical protein
MELSAKAATTSIAKAELTIRRGQESWNYIYIALGFSLSLEGTIIQLIMIRWPYNLIIYIVVAIITGYLFLFSGRMQNLLFGIRQKYESAPR